uniref:Putative ionotropic receptor IR1.2 n=1 Tax=Athetis lepigone TaxID=1223490 RepID=A0A1B3B740_ATHLE|nr:putative ionotropic receptor IR1.2 [Athetis lepigone]
MWYLAVVISIFPCLISGLDQNSLNFGIEYLRYRDLKFVCLLTCEKDISWALQFSKSSSRFMMAVSGAFIDDSMSDFERVENCLQRKLYPVGVLIDSGCGKTEEVMYFASQNMWLDGNHKWVLINDDGSETERYGDVDNNTVMFDNDKNSSIMDTGIMEVLSNLNISVDADIVVAERDNSNYILYDIFNYGKIQGGNLNVHEVGSWGPHNGFNLDINLNGYKYYRRWDFQDITMRMILVAQPAPRHFDLESLTKPTPVPGVAVITQISTAVLYDVAKMHNFRFTPTITDRWIGEYEKNSSKVVTNALYFREQDISPTIRRLKAVQEHNDVLNSPLTAIETRYYYRIPTKGPGKYENQFLRPLTPTAWWAVIAVSTLCAFLLLLSAMSEQRPSSLQYAVFSVVASICQQFFEDIDDGGTKRISTARKVTILVTGLSCVLLYNYYTSSVVSWLLNGPPPSINSLKELLDSPLELIFEDIGYTRSWLQNPLYYYNKRNALMEDELRKKKVLNKKKNAPLLVNLVEGIEMVQRGGFAYHTEVNSANALISKTFTQDELCELGSLQSMEKTLLYPVLQKYSPFREFMNWSIKRLTEQGIVSCIQLRRSSFEVKCEGSSPRALALGGAAPAFILLAGGYFFATVIMLIERYVYKMKHSHVILK